MIIDIDELKEGKWNGQYIWVCDYRFSDMDDKPIRHVKPQKVLVKSNDELPKNKRIYYSSSHLVGLNKKGEPVKSKIYGVFDNTGFRSYTGVSLNAFTTKEECVAKYIEQCEKVENDIEEWLKSCINRRDILLSEISEVKQSFGITHTL